MTRPEGVDSGRFGDRFILSRVIGQGGGAVVYLAREIAFPRNVAIKELLAAIASPESIERFLREVRICSRLVHTNIVQIFEAGTANGLPYYVMPFVEGETLRALLEREPRLGVEHAVRIAGEIADALNYAHAASIVHRDIKPENILMADGHAMVADFGIAKAKAVVSGGEVDPDGSNTTAEKIIGTAPYMSPEQQLGDETIDGRSDIYSLASVLFEMLTGAPPFGSANTAQIFSRRLMEEAPSLTLFRKDVPADLDAVLKRALDREPARRYPTGREFAKALGAAIRTESSFPTPPDGTPSIAVLRFKHSPPDQGSEYFSNGMTEGVMTALGLLRRVRVVARSSVFLLEAEVKDIRELAQRLNARFLLEGTITQRDGEMRISVGLVDADGFSVVNRSFVRGVTEAMAMQDEIATSIVETIRPSLFGVTSPARPQTSPEAYLQYLKGRHFWNIRTPPAMDQAEECFRRVVELDPDYALGHAGLADVAHSRYIYGYADPMISLPLARDSALRAIELDPFAAEPHAALGTVRAVLEWNWEEATTEFRRAIALDPTYSSAYGWFANYVLVPLGRIDDALAELSRARAVDPLSAHIGGSFGMAYYYARRYEEAEAECRAVLDFADHFLIAYYFLGRSLVARGRYEEALSVFQQMGKRSAGSPHVPAELGYLYARMGDRQRAESELNMLRALSSQRFVSSCLSAQIHAALGNTDLAMAGFEVGFAEHSTDLLWLGVHPGLDEMRKDPRFQALLRRIGLVG